MTKTHLILNGLNVKVTEWKVTIFDDMDDVSPAEGEAIIDYLLAEGFLEDTDVELDIVRRGD